MPEKSIQSEESVGLFFVLAIILSKSAFNHNGYKTGEGVGEGGGVAQWLEIDR